MLEYFLVFNQDKYPPVLDKEQQVAHKEQKR
jgi:hypothetical protein